MCYWDNISQTCNNMCVIIKRIIIIYGLSKWASWTTAYTLEQSTLLLRPPSCCPNEKLANCHFITFYIINYEQTEHQPCRYDTNLFGNEKCFQSASVPVGWQQTSILTFSNIKIKIKVK